MHPDHFVVIGQLVADASAIIREHDPNKRIARDCDVPGFLYGLEDAPVSARMGFISVHFLNALEDFSLQTFERAHRNVVPAKRAQGFCREKLFSRFVQVLGKCWRACLQRCDIRKRAFLFLPIGIKKLLDVGVLISLYQCWWLRDRYCARRKAPTKAKGKCFVF